MRYRSIDLRTWRYHGNRDFICICVQTRLTTRSSLPPSTLSHPGGTTVFSDDQSSPGRLRLDPYLLALHRKAYRYKRGEGDVHPRYMGRTETPSRRYGRRVGKEANSSGSLFAGAIPYRDIFMTDIFAAVDLVATLPASCKSRRKKSRLGWMLRRARSKQEPAGSDYL